MGGLAHLVPRRVRRRVRPVARRQLASTRFRLLALINALGARARTKQHALADLRFRRLRDGDEQKGRRLFTAPAALLKPALGGCTCV